jgi:hypothetical protein
MTKTLEVLFMNQRLFDSSLEDRIIMFQLSCNLGYFMGIPLIFGLSTIFFTTSKEVIKGKLGERKECI